MQEIIEIYTKSGTFNKNREIMKEVERIRKHEEMFVFEELARYICENPNGKNILVELQVSTKWHRDNCNDDFIDIVAYEFDGKLEDYTAETELETVPFNGNWKTAIEQMKALAEKIKRKCNNEMREEAKK